MHRMLQTYLLYVCACPNQSLLGGDSIKLPTLFLKSWPCPSRPQSHILALHEMQTILEQGSHPRVQERAADEDIQVPRPHTKRIHEFISIREGLNPAPVMPVA